MACCPFCCVEAMPIYLCSSFILLMASDVAQLWISDTGGMRDKSTAACARSS